jgi:hypothetical protein
VDKLLESAHEVTEDHDEHLEVIKSAKEKAEKKIPDPPDNIIPEIGFSD